MNSKIKIPYINFNRQWEEEKSELFPIIDKIFSKGHYVGGIEISIFEKNISKFIGTKYSVALNSGTDALTIGLHLLGIKKGDEVITPPNSFIASTGAIVHLGAKPVFVDVLENQNIDPSKIEKVITSKTKAIMPVHLTGRICEMDKIIKIANKYNLFIIEDAAQAIGSKYKGKYSGSFGHVGCFSTHPLKNLNSYGDGGFITTNNKKIYQVAMILRNQGLLDRNTVKRFGLVSRMDNVQAGILNYRLRKLNKTIKKRRKNAKLYLTGLDKNKLILPTENKNEYNTYQTFVIQTDRRDKLNRYLRKNGVESAIHYPVPIHLQPASNFLSYKEGSLLVTELQAKQILSLPIHQFLKKYEIELIIQLINKFFK